MNYDFARPLCCYFGTNNKMFTSNLVDIFDTKYYYFHLGKLFNATNKTCPSIITFCQAFSLAIPTESFHPLYSPPHFVIIIMCIKPVDRRLPLMG